MKVDVFEAAKQLGNLIASSDKMTRLKDAEAKLEDNAEARELMDKYKELQVNLVRATKSRVSPQELDSLKEELMACQNVLNENPVTKEYLESKSDFDSFTKTINKVIEYAMTGDEGEGCSPSKCGGCSGCH